MAGVAGTNYDLTGYPFDPQNSLVPQDYKQMGGSPQLTAAHQHRVGYFRTIQIPSAQVLTLNTVPIQLVPAQGANTIIIPELLVATMVYNSTTYAANASGASLIYGVNGAGTSTGWTLSQGFFQTASGTATQVVGQSSSATFSPATTDYNAPLTLIMSTANPTTGNSDIYVRIYYMVVGVPLGPSSTSGFVYP